MLHAKTAALTARPWRTEARSQPESPGPGEAHDGPATRPDRRRSAGGRPGALAIRWPSSALTRR